MASFNSDTYVYRSYLSPLAQASDFEIADKHPDIRGWDVLGKDGAKFGKVHELIVDLKALKVRYLDVDIHKKLIADDAEAMQILIPIGVVILNRDDKNVICPQLSVDSLQEYPVYRREPVYVLRDYERSVRDFYAGNMAGSHRYDPNFYEDKYYDDRELF